MSALLQRTFVREDTPTIMDGLVIRYRLGGAEISASRNGVSIHMTGLDKPEQFLEVKKYIDRAYMQFDSLSVGKHAIEEMDMPADSLTQLLGELADAQKIIIGLMNVLPDTTQREDKCWRWAWEELNDDAQELVKEKRHAACAWIEANPDK